MRSIVSSVSLLLSTMQVAVTIIGQPMQARAMIPTAQSNVILAQAAGIPQLSNVLEQRDFNRAVALIEQNWEKQYEDFFNTNFSDSSMTVRDIRNTLSRITTQTGKKPALLYVVPRPQQLELILISPGKRPIHKSIPAAKREVLLEQIKELKISITDPTHRNDTNYLPPAKQLYQWMVAPLEADLQAQKIDTLMFCMGAGLRTLPLSALHDGQKFLVEKYSITRIPAFKLTDTVYTDLRNSQVLAMGASEFKEQNPLPAVPAELEAIARDLWQGKFFLNQQFTINNLQSQRQQQPFQIIHLATHADIRAGEPSNSYVQFWDEKLTLEAMSKLRWNEPPVELLVLSACKTAIGNEQAELGFAGLAVQAGVKSAIASLWYVSDEGTLALMTEFYRDLKTAPIKAEALRQAQIIMLKGQVKIKDGQLQSPRGNISLPPPLATANNESLSHPYYWAAFTVVGSPW